MSLEILSFVLGPLANNTYLIADLTTGAAAIVDPSFDSTQVVQALRQRGWRLEAIWITHAHFDHIAGVAEVNKGWGAPVSVALHPEDLPLWESKGGARSFGVTIDPGPAPDTMLSGGQVLQLGDSHLEVRHVPGHSRGHVVIYSASAGALFCGDVIFQGSIGRTDLPGGDFDELVAGIRSQVLTLPDTTRLLPGHGPETTVGEEKLRNPFLR
ncbi:MAG: MBL fold metallo-hydrolase [Anaerolineaceae bacterium]|nr:MBL fold metallo-hydrolase [Anaerolineaceae bacterium]